MSNSKSGATLDTSAPDTDTAETEDAEGAFIWKPTSVFDRLLIGVYTAVRGNLRYVAVAAVAVVVVSNVSVAVAGMFLSPLVGVFTLVSLIPALLVAVYVWESNPLDRTFSFGVASSYVLGVLFCGLAYVLNTAAQSWFVALPAGTALFFFLFVGPVEETVKLTAVYLSGYDSRLFRGAIDGAAYGAFAALGFATAENALYIVGDGIFTTSPFLGTLVARAGVGPAHVIWSAIAGYFLGLAKTTPDYTVPVVLKGVIIATALHATYNMFVTYRGALAESIAVSVPVSTASTVVYAVFLLTFYIGIWLLLERLVRRYRRAYAEHGLPVPEDPEPSTDDDNDTPSPLASTAIGTLVSLLR
ncbi:PrsW family glutamic-type intramembrane protease [Haladaptatus sp. F3-133]|jgi:RsiW-degrading membrane proteinase PrsW (M82 family)|uniref:PrsW family glutamic-type intramembrane protease n=1 Tax=Halorutilus salinus TaxID=2487751 RepID=A0A9Q4GG37_9EURY|nr:PrsW family glutamic-type intramembrane protease [Halorutilus salinus]MCX2818764.1 PrsW family glutamic-type intramembrane protease [Halorutilus salinus]